MVANLFSVDLRHFAVVSFQSCFSVSALCPYHPLPLTHPQSHLAVLALYPDSHPLHNQSQTPLN